MSAPGTFNRRPRIARTGCGRARLLTVALVLLGASTGWSKMSALAEGHEPAATRSESRPTAAAPITGFIDRAVTINGTRHPYQVYVPGNWQVGQSWPVVLFLHGAGERGTAGLRQTAVGLPQMIRKSGRPFPAIVVMPQVPPHQWWSTPGLPEAAIAALDESVARYHGDPARVYLTGLSMGGYGVWHLATLYADRFAALVSICGRLRPPAYIGASPGSIAASSKNVYAETARRIAHLPVWVAHGRRDEVVPVTESRQIVAELRALGAAVEYREYDAAHDVWDEAYADAELYEWLWPKHHSGPSARVSAAQ